MVSLLDAELLAILQVQSLYQNFASSISAKTGVGHRPEEETATAVDID